MPMDDNSLLTIVCELLAEAMSRTSRVLVGLKGRCWRRGWVEIRRVSEMQSDTYGGQTFPPPRPDARHPRPLQLPVKRPFPLLHTCRGLFGKSFII
jgi:hypothetical protein